MYDIKFKYTYIGAYIKLMEEYACACKLKMNNKRNDVVKRVNGILIKDKRVKSILLQAK